MSKISSRICLENGFWISPQLKVVNQIGEGWEGSVFEVKEVPTGIKRVAKVFHPKKTNSSKKVVAQARRLHRLRKCNKVVQYVSGGDFDIGGLKLSYYISDYIDGPSLQEYLKSQAGKRLRGFQAVHLLHACAVALEDIHSLGEYHGDIHSENVIIQSFGIRTEIKLLDPHDWGRPTLDLQRHDIYCLIRMFYQSLGGARFYSRQPDSIKNICCGMRTSKIAKKFRSAGQLRRFLEELSM